MGKKIFGIYLAKLDAPNSEAHARLELPASPWELHDAMDKVQLQENEELYLEIDDYYGFEYLAPHLMELDASLNELNDLAGRLAVLDETEQEAFDGLLRLEIQRKVESNGSILTMQDLRTLAVSAGADCCHVVGATSDAELGRFYAENGFMEELDGLSDDVFEMLDFGKIGKALRTGENGTFTRSGYVVKHSELVTAPPCAKELPEKPEYGFLTKYIFADGIEEIDINSWRDIEIQYSDGHTAKLEEHFDSPEHAANVIRRMLQNSGKVLDNASPIITSRLAKNIRISVIKTPVLDEDAGVAASIRIVNPRNLSKADFVQSGTATEEMLDFLSACLRYGVSICVAGATSSGKTTVAGWLLSTIPDRKRIFTIEDGSRELQLIRERDGMVTNSVVHTQTRDSENERQRIDQIALLDIALRFNPDIICVGEMRGPEANAAQEAARVGIAVLTTIHSNSSEGTYRRMVSLCKRAVDTPDDTLMGYVTEAYPIVVYCRQLENKQRRITNISECEILPDGSRRLHKLYEYHITDNHLEDNRFIIEGEHRKCEEISESLRRRFIENGMPLGELAQFVQGKEEDE